MSSTVATNGGEKYLILIDCPACGSSRIQALMWDRRDETRLLGVIPYANGGAWVLCTHCNRLLSSRRKCADCLGASPQDLVGVIAEPIPANSRIAAIASALLCLIPLLGLPIALSAAIYNRSTPAWPRLVSFVSLGLTVLAQAAYAVLIFGS